jgi:prevent-host-death family protein
MKRVSVAEAKAHLPELLRKVDRAPRAAIEVTRHGVVVGAIVGTRALEKLKRTTRNDPYRAWLKWRAAVDERVLSDTSDLFERIDEPTPPPVDFG